MYILILFYIILSVFVLYIFGALTLVLLGAKGENKGFYSVFVRLLTGILAIVFFYSAIKTRGNTIHSGFLIIAAFVFFHNKKNIKDITFTDLIPQKENLIPMFVVLVLSVLFFLFYSSFYYSNPFNNILHYDEVFYSFQSSKLGLFGIESTSAIHNLHDSFGATPYHYTELWLSNLLSEIFIIKPITALSIMVRVIFSTILACSMLSLAELFKPNKLIYILSILSIFIAPFILDYDNVLQRASNAYHIKSIFASCFFVWFVILILSKSDFWYLPLLILPIINIAFAPVVIPSAALFSLLLILRNQSIKRDISILIYLVLESVFIVTFYYFQHYGNNSEATFSLPNLLPYYDIRFLINDSIERIKNYLMYSIYFIPFLILFFIILTHLKKGFDASTFIRIIPIFIYTVLAMIVGNVIQFLFYPIAGINTGQMNGLNYTHLLNTLTFVSFITVFQYIKHKKALRLPFYVFILIILGYNLTFFIITIYNSKFNPKDTRSQEYISSVSEYFKSKNIGIIGGCLLAEDELDNMKTDFIKGARPRGELTSGYWFTPYCMTNNFLYIKNLNPYVYTQQKKDSVPLQFNRETEYLIESSRRFEQEEPLTLFNRINKSKNEIGTKGSTLLGFALNQQMEYIIVSKNIDIPVEFTSIIDTVMIDKKTGEKFVFLSKKLN